MNNLVGQRLGQYEVLSLLGRGGMAMVYRARQPSIGREVAIKVIDPYLDEPAELAVRFERESRIVASLSHPHIIKVFDYGDQDGLLYLVMELLQGGSLATQIRKGPLSTDVTSRILDQMASALDYAHDLDVVHRDLKPQNVLLDSRHNVQITDFGLAKLLNQQTSLTQSGNARGTPAYMSPEQWLGEDVDRRTDLYCLGVMLFEMLTGQIPFSASTPYAVMQMHVEQPPPPIRALRGDLPYGVEGVMLRALAKDPEDRFPSAGRLAADFKAALEGRTSSSTVQFPITSTERSKPGAKAPTAVGNPTQLLAPPSHRPARRPIARVLAITAVLIVTLGIAFYIISSSANKGVLGLPTAEASPTQFRAALAISPQTTTSSPSVTLTRTLATPTAQPNLETLAAQTIAARPTLTAIAIESFTPTSTPNEQQTLVMMVNATDTAVAVASFTKTLTPTQTSTPTLTSTNIPCVIYVSGKGDQQQANVRSGPGTNYPIYQTLTPKDGKYRVTGQFLDNDNNRWWQIQFTDKLLGYVSDTFVTTEGVCDNTPKVTAPPGPTHAATTTPTTVAGGSSGNGNGGNGGSAPTARPTQPAQPTFPIQLTLPTVGLP